MQKKNLIIIISIIAGILLIPLVAMQFTDEVNWGVLDFIVAGFLLLCAGLAINFTLKKLNNSKFKIGVILFIVTILFLIWVELAVGLFGTPFSGS